MNGRDADWQSSTSQGGDADAAGAPAGYKDFLTLWKDDNPDIQVLKQSKAEYANLE